MTAPCRYVFDAELRVLHLTFDDALLNRGAPVHSAWMSRVRNALAYASGTSHTYLPAWRLMWPVVTLKSGSRSGSCPMMSLGGKGEARGAGFSPGKRWKGGGLPQFPRTTPGCNWDPRKACPARVFCLRCLCVENNDRRKLVPEPSGGSMAISVAGESRWRSGRGGTS